MAIGPALDLGEVAAAAALDHVAGKREGRAGEAQQGGLLRQRCAYLADCLVDRRQALGQPRPRQLAELDRIGQRVELRSLALLEPDFLAERVGDHQDVGKDDRRIEPEAPDRLQGHLDRLVRRVAEFEKRLGRRADGAILRQIAPGLPHQPDRRRRKARPGQRRHEFPGDFPGAQVLSLMLPLTLFIIGSRSSRGCGTWGCALLAFAPQPAVDRLRSIPRDSSVGFPIRRPFLPDCPQGTNSGSARASRVPNSDVLVRAPRLSLFCHGQYRVSPRGAVG